MENIIVRLTRSVSLRKNVVFPMTIITVKLRKHVFLTVSLVVLQVKVHVLIGHKTEGLYKDALSIVVIVTQIITGVLY
jgi:hypothetical protein